MIKGKLGPFSDFFVSLTKEFKNGLKWKFKDNFIRVLKKTPPGQTSCEGREGRALLCKLAWRLTHVTSSYMQCVLACVRVCVCWGGALEKE